MPAFTTFSLVAILIGQTFGIIHPATNIIPSDYLHTALESQTTCSQGNGMIVDSSFDSEIYHAPVKYSIYLPPCYDMEPSIRFPVIYLLHGQTFDYRQWVRLGLAEIADELINDHQLAPVIIVLPNDPDWRQPDESPFGRMMLEELIPTIDKTYLTLNDRQNRAIGGLSRGASWALHLGLSEWQLFSRVGLHSLPIFATDGPIIPRWLEAIPADSTPQIYIDMGNQDPELNSARYFEKLLSDRHLPHEWHMFTGAHEETYWSRHIKNYLLWYACEWTVMYYN